MSSVPLYRIELKTPDVEYVISVAANQNIWDVAQKNGIALPAICHQGRCLTCAGRLMGTGAVDQSAAELYLPQDRAAGFALLCTAKPRSNLRIMTHCEDEMRHHRLAAGLPAPYS
jgi:ferredoxin